jgi:putative transposase
MAQRFAKPHRLHRDAYRGEICLAVTACLEGRKPLFTDAEVVGAFIATLSDVAARWSCAVPVYCFMPDHLHLVLQGLSPRADLYGAVIEFKQRTGYWLRRNRPEASWQKGFYDHVLRESEDLTTQVRYVLDNPRRKGLVSSWDQYHFSGSVGCELADVLAGLPFRKR